MGLMIRLLELQLSFVVISNLRYKILCSPGEDGKCTIFSEFDKYKWTGHYECISYT